MLCRRGVDRAGDSVSGFMGALGIQFLKRSRSLEMAVSCSWWMVEGAYLTVHERKLSSWTMRFPSVNVFWVRYSCMNSTVSENRRALVAKINNVEAAVVLECGSDVEPFAAAEVPSFADVQLGVNYDGASNRSYRCGVKVEGPKEVLPSGHLRCNSVLTEEVECELSLGEELIPDKVRERVVNTCKDCKKIEL